jgi:hypothetical protein
MDSDLASSGRLRFSSGIPSLLFSSGRFSLAIPLAVELFAEYARLTTKQPRTRIRIRNSVPSDLSSYVPSKQIPDSLREPFLFTISLCICLSVCLSVTPAEACSLHSSNLSFLVLLQTKSLRLLCSFLLLLYRAPISRCGAAIRDKQTVQDQHLSQAN